MASLERPNCLPHCRSPLHIFSFLERFTYSFSAGVWQNTEPVNAISWVLPREWDIRCQRPIHGSVRRDDAWRLKLSFSRLANTNTPYTLPTIPSRKQQDCSDGMQLHINYTWPRLWQCIQVTIHRLFKILPKTMGLLLELLQDPQSIAK